ncbi:MAG: hypothetical protein K6E53_03840 [Lachnospiraceae bacterium]|nr:hypothetical protein [Lachnospiraceae bacterium]
MITVMATANMIQPVKRLYEVFCSCVFFNSVVSLLSVVKIITKLTAIADADADEMA